MKNKLLGFDKRLIVSDYNNNLPIKDILLKYNISSKTLYRVLDLFEIKKRGSKRTWFFNEFYFDKINTKDKAYFLGLLYADGNNFPDSGRVQLKLKKSDRSILDIFSKYISKENGCSIRDVKKDIGEDQCVVSMSSMYMSRSLIKKGVYKNKTFILEFPNEDQVPNRLISHFLRGYFDGDGCITTNKGKNAKNVSYSFILSGRLEFLLKAQEVLIKEVGISCNKIIKNKTIHNLVYGGNLQSYNIFKYLYNNCGDLKLNRKFIRFKCLEKQYYLKQQTKFKLVKI